MAHIQTSRQNKINFFLNCGLCVVSVVCQWSRAAGCMAETREDLENDPVVTVFIDMCYWQIHHRGSKAKGKTSILDFLFSRQWHVKSSQKNDLPGTVRLVLSKGKHSQNSLDRKFLQDFCSWWQLTFFAYSGILAQWETFPSFRSSGSFSVG